MVEAPWWKKLFDYSGVGEAMPEHIGRDKPMDPIVNAGISMATLPKRAMGASAEAVTSGIYNPGPALETVGNMAGVGSMAGVSAAPMEAIFGSGILRRKPLIAGYHGTGSPTEFAQFKLPPATHDLGIHGTIDPSVSNMYTYDKHSFEHSLSHLNPEGGDIAHVRTMPIVMDVQNALKYPIDAGKWNIPENVINPLAEKVAKGYKTPRGLLSDMENIAGSKQMWQEQFVPMLKERGYDSIYYPHGTEYGDRNKYNTFMGFDAEQFMPRMSPGGQKLIGERGVHEPMKVDPSYTSETPKWRIPSGILKRIDDPEPPEAAKGILKKQRNVYKEKLEQLKKEQEAKFALGGKKAAEIELTKDWDANKLTNAELFQKHQELYGYKTPRENISLSINPYQFLHMNNEALAQAQTTKSMLDPEYAKLVAEYEKKYSKPYPGFK
jgi:hypothetical protein